MKAENFEKKERIKVTDVSRFPTRLYTYSATFAFRLHNKDRGRILEKQNGHFSEFISSFTRASQSCRTRRGKRVKDSRHEIFLVGIYVCK